MAITRPPASGTWRRTSESRLSAAASTDGHPRPGRVERGAQRLRGQVLGQRLAEPGGDLVAGAGAPLHLAGVGHEQHRPDDVVGQRVRVAVGEVGDRARHAVVAGRVGDERDRVDVGAERRAGQRQPAGRRLERLAHALAPRQRVAGVVHLVEDHQRLEPLGADPHRERVDRDAGVGDRDADEVAARSCPCRRRTSGRSGCPARAAASAHWILRCSVGATIVIRSTMPAAEQLGRDRERERRLAGARRRDGEEVARGPVEVVRHRRRLPGAQGRGRPPGRALRPGRSERVGLGGRRSGRPVTRRRPRRRLHGLPDLLALRADRELLRRPARHPDLAAEGDDGGAHHHRLGELVLLDVVREPLVVTLVGRDGTPVLDGRPCLSRIRWWSSRPM